MPVLDSDVAVRFLQALVSMSSQIELTYNFGVFHRKWKLISVGLLPDGPCATFKGYASEGRWAACVTLRMEHRKPALRFETAPISSGSSQLLDDILRIAKDAGVKTPGK